MAKVSRIQQCGLDVLYPSTYLDNFPPYTLTFHHIRPFEAQILSSLETHLSVNFLAKDVQYVISSVYDLTRVIAF